MMLRLDAPLHPSESFRVVRIIIMCLKVLVCQKFADWFWFVSSSKLPIAHLPGRSSTSSPVQLEVVLEEVWKLNPKFEVQVMKAGDSDGGGRRTTVDFGPLPVAAGWTRSDSKTQLLRYRHHKELDGVLRDGNVSEHRAKRSVRARQPAPRHCKPGDRRVRSWGPGRPARHLQHCRLSGARVVDDNKHAEPSRARAGWLPRAHGS